MPPDSRIRVYVKKRVQFENMNIDQQSMLKIGTVAIATVKNRVQKALDENDSRAKPLAEYYRVKKTRAGGSNVRDLTFTGEMLKNFTVRTVSNYEAIGRNTTKKNRDKAQGNNDRQRWIAYSRTNENQVRNAAREVLMQAFQNCVKTKE